MYLSGKMVNLKELENVTKLKELPVKFQERIQRNLGYWDSSTGLTLLNKNETFAVRRQLAFSNGNFHLLLITWCTS